MRQGVDIVAKHYSNILVLGPNGVLEEQPLNHKTRSGKTIITTAARFDDRRDSMETNKTDPAAVGKATTYANFAQTQEVYLKKAKGSGVSAYYIAIADWFEGPKVREINLDDWTGESGQIIRVKARDNVKVARVSVIIRNAQDEVVEMGEAAQSAPGSPWWIYMTRSLVSTTPFPSVEATAYDLPGNRDSFIIS
jgi:hypothetical protein